MDLQVPFLYILTSRGYICFFVGVLLSYFFKQHFNKKLLSIIGLIVTGFLLILTHKYRFEGVFGNITYRFSFIILPVLLLSVTTLQRLQKALSVRPVLYLGRISMSTYLMHRPVFKFIMLVNYCSGRRLKTSSSITFGAILIIILVFSAFEFEIFEKRIFPKYVPKLLEVLKKDT